MSKSKSISRSNQPSPMSQRSSLPSLIKNQGASASKHSKINYGVSEQRFKESSASPLSHNQQSARRRQLGGFDQARANAIQQSALKSAAAIEPRKLFKRQSQGRQCRNVNKTQEPGVVGEDNSYTQLGRKNQSVIGKGIKNYSPSSHRTQHGVSQSQIYDTPMAGNKNNRHNVHQNGIGLNEREDFMDADLEEMAQNLVKFNRKSNKLLESGKCSDQSSSSSDNDYGTKKVQKDSSYVTPMENRNRREESKLFALSSFESVNVGADELNDKQKTSQTRYERHLKGKQRSKGRTQNKSSLHYHSMHKIMDQSADNPQMKSERKKRVSINDSKDSDHCMSARLFSSQRNRDSKLTTAKNFQESQFQNPNRSLFCAPSQPVLQTMPLLPPGYVLAEQSELPVVFKFVKVEEPGRTESTKCNRVHCSHKSASKPKEQKQNKAVETVTKRWESAFEPVENQPDILPPQTLFKIKAARPDSDFKQEDPMVLRKSMFKLMRKLNLIRAETEQKIKEEREAEIQHQEYLLALKNYTNQRQKQITADKSVETLPQSLQPVYKVEVAQEYCNEPDTVKSSRVTIEVENAESIGEDSDSADSDRYGLTLMEQQNITQSDQKKPHVLLANKNIIPQVNSVQRARISSLKEFCSPIKKTLMNKVQSMGLSSNTKQSEASSAETQCCSNFSDMVKMDSSKFNFSNTSTQDQQLRIREFSGRSLAENNYLHKLVNQQKKSKAKPTEESSETDSLADAEESFEEEVVEEIIEEVEDDDSLSESSESELDSEQKKASVFNKVHTNIIRQSTTEIPEEYHYYFDALNDPEKFKAKKQKPRTMIKRTITTKTLKQKKRTQECSSSDSFKTDSEQENAPSEEEQKCDNTGLQFEQLPCLELKDRNYSFAVRPGSKPAHEPSQLTKTQALATNAYQNPFAATQGSRAFSFNMKNSSRNPEQGEDETSLVTQAFPSINLSSAIDQDNQSNAVVQIANQESDQLIHIDAQSEYQLNAVDAADEQTDQQQELEIEQEEEARRRYLSEMSLPYLRRRPTPDYMKRIPKHTKFNVQCTVPRAIVPKKTNAPNFSS